MPGEWKVCEKVWPFLSWPLSHCSAELESAVTVCGASADWSVQVTLPPASMVTVGGVNQ